MGRFISRFTQSDKLTESENEMQRQEKAGVSENINYALFSLLGETLDFDQIIVPLDDESLKIRFFNFLKKKENYKSINLFEHRYSMYRTYNPDQVTLISTSKSN